MAKRKPDPVENVRPIIVKKIIEEGHGGHHGGAWKVAYADFVTAMMAFFLLMWLLGATEEKDRKAIADYFAPTIVELKSGSAGSNGLFGGESIVGRDDYPNRAGQTGTQSITIPQDATGTADEAGNSQYATLTEEQKAAMKKVQQLAEKEKFEKLKKQLEERLGSSEQLSKLLKNVRFTDTREGLRIDLVDEANFSMFALSTDKLVPKAADLLKEVAQVINGMPNPVIIRGHTDALPYASGKTMNNWMLSTSRAEATRRALVIGGINPGQVHRIEGVADKEPYNPADRNDPANRRISITLAFTDAAKGDGPAPGARTSGGMPSRPVPAPLPSK